MISLAAIAQKETTTPADDNLFSVLQRMHVNLVENNELARQYACDDSVHETYFNKSGKKTGEKSEKVESLFVGGMEYHHIVEQNGKPLSDQKLISEQKHQDALSELGADFDFVFDLRDGNPRDSIYSALPICCLTSLFENRILRHDQINGRDNLVVESVPLGNPAVTSDVYRTALDWKQTIWIDTEYLMPTRYEVELLHDKDFLLKGSINRHEFVRFEETSDTKDRPPQKVWLESYSEGQFHLKFLWERLFETFEDTSYNYRKFRVDMRVLPDSVQDVSHQSADQKP
jgi:hypothetical protein